MFDSLSETMKQLGSLIVFKEHNLENFDELHEVISDNTSPFLFSLNAHFV